MEYVCVRLMELNATTDTQFKMSSIWHIMIGRLFFLYNTRIHFFHTYLQRKDKDEIHLCDLELEKSTEIEFSFNSRIEMVLKESEFIWFVIVFKPFKL